MHNTCPKMRFTRIRGKKMSLSIDFFIPLVPRSLSNPKAKIIVYSFTREWTTDDFIFLTFSYNFFVFLDIHQYFRI